MVEVKKKRIIFLVGPTGIGKSAVAIILAKKINAEIISCDSIAVYRKMNIIASKVPLSQRRKIKHHLVDIVSSKEEYNVAKYRKDALTICNKLFQKSKIPLFVGGTGLYYSIIRDGLFPEIGEDRLIRAKLNRQLKSKGGKYLYKKLIKIDPVAAKKIHPNDTRRIIRALEVYLISGKQISLLQKNRIGLDNEYDIKVFGLYLEREELYNRVNLRVDKMFRLGLINEVKWLLKHKISKTAVCAIGINELKGYFNGSYTLDQANYLIRRNSRHYAKRQLTWFKKDKRIEWINIKDKEKPNHVAERIKKFL